VDTDAEMIDLVELLAFRGRAGSGEHRTFVNAQHGVTGPQDSPGAVFFQAALHLLEAENFLVPTGGFLEISHCEIQVVDRDGLFVHGGSPFLKGASSLTVYRQFC
jgi:hypothetical protein